MADTGLPWELPYPVDTDLVRDGASAIQALAEATADGLDAAGGLVEVKTVVKDSPESASTATGGIFAPSGLSITHEVADASNRLILFGFFGALASNSGNANVGVAFHDGTGLFGLGAAGTGQATVTGGGYQVNFGSGGNRLVRPVHFHIVHTPGTGSKTYSIRCINMDTLTKTLYVNRSESDAADANNPRSISVFTLMEVKV
jgi:hypothetical protein